MVNQNQEERHRRQPSPSNVTEETRTSLRADKHGTEKLKAHTRKTDRRGSKNDRRREAEKALYNPFFGYRRRRFPVWQRLLILISLSAIALVGGTMFGFGVLGHGSPWAVFDRDTWLHILDFLKTD